MNVYRVTPAVGFRFLAAPDERSVQAMPALFRGAPSTALWEPPNLQLHHAHRSDQDPDCPYWIGSALVFSRRAVDALADLLSGVELLPLHVPPNQFGFHYDYVALNVLNVIDCVDKSRSVIKRFPSSDRVMHIPKPAFHTGALTGIGLFKIPETPHGPIYATEQLRARYKRAQLTGLAFKLVYRPPLLAFLHRPRNAGA